MKPLPPEADSFDSHPISSRRLRRRCVYTHGVRPKRNKKCTLIMFVFFFFFFFLLSTVSARRSVVNTLRRKKLPRTGSIFSCSWIIDFLIYHIHKIIFFSFSFFLFALGDMRLLMPGCRLFILSYDVDDDGGVDWAGPGGRLCSGFGLVGKACKECRSSKAHSTVLCSSSSFFAFVMDFPLGFPVDSFHIIFII